MQIIPFTWEHTKSARRARPGDAVNLECDMLGKYVVRAMELTGCESGRDRHDDQEPSAAGSRKSVFAPIEEAVDAIRDGQMIIVVDDEDRENEGDLTIAAEKVTPEAINFMAKHGRGLICMPMTEERLERARPAADGRRRTPRASTPPSASRSRRRA